MQKLHECAFRNASEGRGYVHCNPRCGYDITLQETTKPKRYILHSLAPANPSPDPPRNPNHFRQLFGQ